MHKRRQIRFGAEELTTLARRQRPAVQPRDATPSRELVGRTVDRIPQGHFEADELVATLEEHLEQVVDHGGVEPVRVNQQRVRGGAAEQRVRLLLVVCGDVRHVVDVGLSNARRQRVVAAHQSMLVGACRDVLEIVHGHGSDLILAAVYFLKLVYDFGWLTPARQVALALLGGLGLTAGGLSLAARNRAYAAYLPAFGVVILYLTVYAADLYYAMIGPGMVAAGVGATTLAAIWLRRHFDSSVYTVFAVVGTYVFPILLPSRSPDATDLIVYFAARGLLFSWLALQAADRSIYVLALWFSLLGVDFAWRISSASEAWVQAASYQFFQFLLFAITAAVYSTRYRKPLGSLDAVTHGAALFVFYGLEYALLKEHAPAIAPGVALGSVVVVVLLLAWTRRTMGGGPRPRQHP